jgi:hypothetical protein
MPTEATSSATRREWSGCPKCGRDLAQRPLSSKPPLTSCAFCGTELLPVWWIRIIWILLTFAMGFSVPAALGNPGVDLFFAGIICIIPAFVISGIVVFKVVPPKYAAKRSPFVNLITRQPSFRFIRFTRSLRYQVVSGACVSLVYFIFSNTNM